MLIDTANKNPENPSLDKLKETLDSVIKLSYQSHTIETSVREFWGSSNYFPPRAGNGAYCIMQPPPNVTGVLHMGHAFQTALMDGLIRYNRMKGLSTLWQPGIDHAGIATQMVVENQLAALGKTRDEMGRTAFVEAVWNWKEESGNYITKQFYRMGASADWDRSRFTLDDHFSDAVKKVFISLFDEGLIYRGKKLINWDPKLRTAVSDVEVVGEEENGSLWYLKYPIANEPNQHLIVATTRPETMFGDTAVMVHPDDKRYKKWIGKKVKLPLMDKEIPIIADEIVDPTFGTGCVKVTPAHDFNDFATAERHHLPIIDIFTPDAHLNEFVPPDYRGLERFTARTKLIKDLEERGILDRVEAHTSRIPRGEKSGVVVEPRLTEQWFVKTKPLAEVAIAAVEQEKIKFVPEKWSKTYFHWMHNIQDWCISRQLWWGHRIPAWYDKEGKIYVGYDEEDVRKKYSLSSDIILKQDEDVLDTWFSAGLWPFVTLGWPDHTSEFKQFYPNSVLVTGFDIIFFWVARMIMFGLKFTGEIPFKEVYITGLIYDKEGKKMSKTRGNVLDPLDIIDGIDLESLIKKRTFGLMQPKMAKKIEQSTRSEFPEGIPAYGTDALRYSFYSAASTGNNINFHIQSVQDAHHFCNKIWNASKYVLYKMEQQNIKQVLNEKDVEYKKCEAIDQWILSRLQQVIDATHTYYKTYRFDVLAKCLYEFVWNDFCDWYLELSKQILQDPNISDHSKALHSFVLVSVLETLLRLLHPLMPFMTEALWQSVKNLKGIKADTLMLQPYPEKNPDLIKPVIEAEIEWLKNLITSIRSIRGEAVIPPSTFVPILLKKGSKEDNSLVQKYDFLLKNMAKIKSIEWLNAEEKAPPSMAGMLADLEIYIPIKNLVDKKTEMTRLNKEIKKHQDQIMVYKGRLTNENFIQKAPKELIEKETLKLAELESASEKLSKNLSVIESLED